MSPVRDGQGDLWCCRIQGSSMPMIGHAFSTTAAGQERIEGFPSTTDATRSPKLEMKCSISPTFVVCQLRIFGVSKGLWPGCDLALRIFTLRGMCRLNVSFVFPGFQNVIPVWLQINHTFHYRGNTPGDTTLRGPSRIVLRCHDDPVSGSRQRSQMGRFRP